MQDQDLISLKNLRTTLSLVLAVFLVGNSAFGQSLRRSTLGTGALKNVGSPVKAVKQQEVDQRYGRVVWVDGDHAGIIVNAYSNYQDWSNLYYACDPRLEPVAFLLNIGISHRNCRIFLVSDGTVQVGDWVFIKQVPPKDEDEDIEQSDVTSE